MCISENGGSCSAMEGTTLFCFYCCDFVFSPFILCYFVLAFRWWIFIFSLKLEFSVPWFYVYRPCPSFEEEYYIFLEFTFVACSHFLNYMFKVNINWSFTFILCTFSWKSGETKLIFCYNILLSVLLLGTSSTFKPWQ